MEKLILNDKSEVKIKEGSTLNHIVAEVSNFAELQEVAGKLEKQGNLDALQFVSGENITGKYTDMILERPMFKEVDTVNGAVTASFSVREKTDVEKRLDALEAGQNIQEGAIEDLGSVVSELSDGGNM